WARTSTATAPWTAGIATSVGASRRRKSPRCRRTSRPTKARTRADARRGERWLLHPGSPSAERARRWSMGTERLQKILAHAGIASRRAAETLIAEGRVRVNGRVVTELGTRADAH